MSNQARYDYRGARVLVTGGTSGIGGGIAAAYRDAGADVTITGTRAGTADYDGDLSGYRYLRLQLTDDAAIDALAAAVPELDIAGAVLYLTSGAAAFVTGQTLPVDGGYSVMG